MRTVELTRDEAELLVDLIDSNRERMDKRLIWLSEEIRQKFGMVTYEEQMVRRKILEVGND